MLHTEAEMFDEIESIKTTRKRYNSRLFRSGIIGFREIEELESRVLRDGALAQMYKELIALGISISQGCYG